MNRNAMPNDFLQQLLTIFSNQNQELDIIRDVMLTRSEVCERLRISRNTLLAWIKADKFPAPIIIGNNEQRWPSSMINRRIYEDNPHLRHGDELLSDAMQLIEKANAA